MYRIATIFDQASPSKEGSTYWQANVKELCMVVHRCPEPRDRVNFCFGKWACVAVTARGGRAEKTPMLSIEIEKNTSVRERTARETAGRIPSHEPNLPWRREKQALLFRTPYFPGNEKPAIVSIVRPSKEMPLDCRPNSTIKQGGYGMLPSSSALDQRGSVRFLGGPTRERSTAWCTRYTPIA